MPYTLEKQTQPEEWVKIYVACDLEGVAGVVDHRQQCEWDAGREWYAPYWDEEEWEWTMT